MTELTRVQEALLELGLEDFIPLPEAVAVPEVLAEIGNDRPIDAVAGALVDLLRRGFIQVWTGHWQTEPTLVSSQAAETLLLRDEHYKFNSDADLQERVYYVNVDNYREEY